MTIGFYTTYAWRALLRDGQRTFLAILCIMFGVMSVVSMQLLSSMISHNINVDPRIQLGGDVRLANKGHAIGGDTANVSQQQLAQLDALKKDGTLSAYSLVASGDERLLKPAGGGRVYFLTNSPLGVDPANFPLAGAVVMREPAGARLAGVIAKSFDSAVSRDLADRLGLKIGSSYTLADDPSSAPTTLRVGGIIEAVPNGRGDTIYYSLETARQIAGNPLAANTVLATWGSGGPSPARLEQAGWNVMLPQDAAQENADAVDLFGFMLKGAGILGLLVGGIGVANTLQVILARRNLEIATLKTLGYRRRDLLVLFGIETALLGVIGGVIGVALGIAISYFLLSLIGSIGAYLLNFTVDPFIVAGGVLTGVLTAVIFGLYTIVRASSVRPAVLLREMPVRQSWGTRIAGAGLLLILLALFAAISIAIMGKVADGLEVVAGGVVGLGLLGLLLTGLLLLLLSVPTPGLPLLTMARRNLKRRPSRAAIALIALFSGVFAIGFASSIILNAQSRLAARIGPAAQYNLAVYGKLSDEEAITRQLAANGVQTVHSSVQVPAQIQTLDGQTLPITYIEGRDPADVSWDLDVQGAAPQGDGVLASRYWEVLNGQVPVKAGDKVRVTANGVQQEYTLTGFYIPQSAGISTRLTSGLIASKTAIAPFLTPQSAASYVGHVDSTSLQSVAANIGGALPQIVVISQTDINEARNRIFEGLFAFAIGIAALALVAGTILIANAVGLAMVERRREIGILKSVGFTSGRVMSTLLLENGLLGLFAGIAGMGGVGLATVILNGIQPAAKLTLDPVLVLGMIAVSVGLALLSTFAVAWQSTRVRPLEVLRNE